MDGVLTCSAKLLLDNRPLIDNDTQFMVHDLESGSYHLLFARGSANKYSKFFGNQWNIWITEL